MEKLDQNLSVLEISQKHLQQQPDYKEHRYDYAFNSLAKDAEIALERSKCLQGIGGSMMTYNLEVLKGLHLI